MKTYPKNVIVLFLQILAKIEEKVLLEQIQAWVF